MISVPQAYKLVLDTAHSFGSEVVSLSDAIGRVLAEDILADRPVPPFDRVTMDGIAIDYESFAAGQRKFKVESIGPAGAPTVVLKNPSNCVEIMTGAPLPMNTDTVIRYEDLTKEDHYFTINIEVVKGKNIHEKGSDHPNESVLLKKGTVIKAIDINILASVGKATVLVLTKPKIAVVSSGDELVEVAATPKDYQIRKSNAHMLQARLKEIGLDSTSFHFTDDSDEIRNKIASVKKDFDVILMSGGVSKGKFDFIPAVLEELGINKKLHRVAQRPGKPFWFGNDDETIVFAFPGNPVSTLACFHKYFIPWYLNCQGQQYGPIKVVLAADALFKPELTYFAQAKVNQSAEGKWLATINHGNGSGDMVSPSQVDGFIELPPEGELYSKGRIFDFHPFYPIFK